MSLFDFSTPKTRLGSPLFCLCWKLFKQPKIVSRECRLLNYFLCQSNLTLAIYAHFTVGLWPMVKLLFSLGRTIILQCLPLPLDFTFNLPVPSIFHCPKEVTSLNTSHQIYQQQKIFRKTFMQSDVGDICRMALVIYAQWHW